VQQKVPTANCAVVVLIAVMEVASRPEARLAPRLVKKLIQLDLLIQSLLPTALAKVVAVHPMVLQVARVERALLEASPSVAPRVARAA